MHNINYIKQKDIDKNLWNTCVQNSTCNSIYMQSFYLDIMAEGWDAIVVNNYEAVFAIPHRKKFGIKYIYHPAFVQHLGLCSTNNSISFKDVLPTIEKHFNYADLFLNFSNKRIHYSEERTNYILTLDNDYNYYRKLYSKDLKKNLVKSNKGNLIFKVNKQIKLAQELYKENYKNRHKNITLQDYKNFEQLCNLLELENKIFTYSITNFRNEIFAIALFLCHGNRIYNLMNTTTAKGKSLSANHFLFDKIIEEFSSTGIVLDFEGSDLQGVKEFYKNFNPSYEPYYYYKLNNLSPILKIFKK